jgi:MFS superfamily sulfate permease-like transporter
MRSILSPKSYAKLAGLPVQYGLYSALVPLYVYAVFGSSRHLSVGPVAITSLLLSTGLTKVLEEEGVPVDDPTYEPRYIQLAIQTSLLVGLVYVAMAALGLGFITLFLSHAVISGFTSGAAIVRPAVELDLELL